MQPYSLIKRIALFVSAPLLLASCSEDFFNQVVDADPPEYEKLLVAHLNASVGDTIMFFDLTRNFGILEPVTDSDWYVTGARVELLEDGQTLLEFVSLPLQPQRYATEVPSGAIKAGHTYTLRIMHPDYDTVTAVQTVPQPPRVDSVRFKQNGGLNAAGEELSDIDIYLKDPSDEENFYEVSIIGIYEYIDSVYDAFGNLVYVDTLRYESQFDPEGSDDPNVEFGMNYTLLISDRFFNGQAYKLNARLYRYDGQARRYGVTVRCVTRDYFQYSITALRKYDTEGIPFVEPVSVFNNLTNGIGIFGLANGVTVEAKE